MEQPVYVVDDTHRIYSLTLALAFLFAWRKRFFAKLFRTDPFRDVRFKIAPPVPYPCFRKTMDQLLAEDIKFKCTPARIKYELRILTIEGVQGLCSFQDINPRVGYENGRVHSSGCIAILIPPIIFRHTKSTNAGSFVEIWASSVTVTVEGAVRFDSSWDPLNMCEGSRDMLILQALELAVEIGDLNLHRIQPAQVLLWRRALDILKEANVRQARIKRSLARTRAETAAAGGAGLSNYADESDDEVFFESESRWRDATASPQSPHDAAPEASESVIFEREYQHTPASVNNRDLVVREYEIVGSMALLPRLLEPDLEPLLETSKELDPSETVQGQAEVRSADLETGPDIDTVRDEPKVRLTLICPSSRSFFSI